ncbi:immunoglobulin lambda-1 light chain-like [Carcharodon carcharias]|uniref:immunoglobulin lambda-1 light chain-like n=1 Tax=Carcharodon carcharias TaxID=13397 RepID=UPI001B7ED12A|nr:immunoglobulin lambda-1 light chain-like [Carcharodon carcharias]
MTQWVRVLSALMLCLHSTNADPVLTQPGSISTSPEKTVKITCTMSGGSIGSYYTSWYWQKPGSAPVLVWDENDNTASGIPDRFTGAVESSTNTMHLTITNVKSEDAADYYCAVAESGIVTFGRGTKLNLDNPRVPSVSLLPPSSDQITAKNKATLVCLVSGFNPGAVEIEWTVDGSVRGNGVETSRIQQERDNTFSVSSYLTLSASDWDSHELYSCLVKHETQANPFRSSISRSSCV